MAIIVTDTEGRVTDWNVGAERILGWSAEEIRGQAIDERGGGQRVFALLAQQHLVQAAVEGQLPGGHVVGRHASA